MATAEESFMKKLAAYATLAALAHAVIVVWHLIVPAKIPPGLDGQRVLSAAIAINVVPLLGLMLLISIEGRERKTMTTHKTGTPEERLAARLELLKAEKELTRQSDELVRQRLPRVRIDKKYQFETDEGKASLANLFRGRSQLLVYHFMFGADYTAGCPTCSTIADGFNGFAIHLANHDVMLWAVSGAPLAKLQAYKRRMGWTFPWASSFGGDFNADFSASFTEAEQREGGIEYNYRREPPASQMSFKMGKEAGDDSPPAPGASMTGTNVAAYLRERPGMSAFALEDGVVYC